MKALKLPLGVIILMLVLSLFNTAKAETVDLGTITYPGECVNTVQDNISLIFKSSDNNNLSDVVILNQDFLPSNYTFFRFSCINITYDWNFVNNTKSYYYLDINNVTGNKTYRVGVNFKSINVPEPPWMSLVKLLAVQNGTIANLTENVSILQNNITQLNNLISTYSNNLNALQSSYDSLQLTYDDYRESTNNLVSGYWNLVNESVNKSFEINRLGGNVYTLTADRDNYKTAFEDVTGTWSTGYKKDGKEQFYFNGAWFFGGGVVFVIAFVLLLNFYNKGGTKIIANKAIERKAKKKEEAYREAIKEEEEVPEIEKKVLTPVDHQKLQEEVDEILNGNKKTDTRKDNWWKTPDGLKRKEELRREMQEINERKRNK